MNEDSTQPSDETPRQKDDTTLITEILDADRPHNLYDPGDRSWRQRAERELAKVSTGRIQEMVDDYIRRRVDGVERDATIWPVRHLRAYGKQLRTGQLPLWAPSSEEWKDILPLDLLAKPVAFWHRTIQEDEEGNRSVVRERVRCRFGDLSPDDIQEWLDTSRKESDDRAQADADFRRMGDALRDVMLANERSRVNLLTVE